MNFSLFHFDRFVLDPASRELLLDGKRVAIPPKSFECIEYLVRHRARAVGRDELISAVWGRIDVSDALLGQTLLRARRAVNDTGSEQTTIRTLPRFGYQWVATVEEFERESDAPTTTQLAATTATAVDAEGARSGPPRRFLVATMAAAIAIIAVTAGWLLRKPEPVAEVADLYLVAPVSLDHDAAETAWVRLGVMDYIATRLREDGRLSVLPSARVVALLDPARSDPIASNSSLAALTGASHLLEASASRNAGGWHIAIDSTSRGDHQRHSGDGPTLLTAADRAIASLLSGLGNRPLKSLSPGANPLDESTQRIDAALLEGNLSAARAVMSSLSEEERDAPQIRVREGQILFRGDHIDEADGLFSALEARLGQWPVDVQAQTLMGLGAVAVRRRDFHAAERRYAEALAALGEQGSPELVGNGYNGRGVARAAQRQFDLALGDFSRARIALGRAGDTPGVASIDTNLGLLEAHRGQLSEALQAFDRAIEVFSRYRIEDNLAASLLGKSGVQFSLVDYAAARDSSERAKELARQLDNSVLEREIDLLPI